nr:hypothetical protein CDL12_07242 [Ipomoea batatas]
MAGLQYNFFPTDLLYPLAQKPVGKDNQAPNQVSLIKSKKASNVNAEQAKGVIISTKPLKAVSPPEDQGGNPGIKGKRTN